MSNPRRATGRREMPRALLVEGPDDMNTIAQLMLKRHPHLEPTSWFDFPRVDGLEAEGADAILSQLRLRARASAENIVGAVLDADGAPTRRWQGILDRLDAEGYADLPPEPAAAGLIVPADPIRGLARVGVWLMPDNLSAGMLEDFLHRLNATDALMQYAAATVDALPPELRRFDPATRRSKAVVHTHLAWQAEPGKPYGLAIKANHLATDHPLADAFVAWLEALFGPPPERL